MVELRAYVSTSLRSAELLATAGEVAKAIERAGWTAYLPHRDTAAPEIDVDPAIVFERNQSALLQSRCVVAEITSPSVGVGIEIDLAAAAGIPLLILHRTGTRVSKMVRGHPGRVTVESYASSEERDAAVEAVLRGLSTNTPPLATRGQLIVVEGLDGAGKSTVVPLVRDRLERGGIPTLLTSDPPSLEPWKAGALVGKHSIDPVAEAFLRLTERIDNSARTIRPAIASHSWVVCDRFFHSWLAYQSVGLARELGSEERARALLLSLQGLASAHNLLPVPDHLFFLTARTEVRAERITSRGARSRWEDPSTQARVEAAYGWALEMGGVPPVRIDTSDLPASRVADAIVERVTANRGRSE